MHISSLHLYPIKGCRGRAVDSATLDHLGFVGDRRLMLVDETGRFLSQREVPILATLEPELDGESLTVRARGSETLRMTVDPDGALRPVSVWGGKLVANDQGKQAAAWFSHVLDVRCSLVRFGPASHNPVDPKYSPRPDAETAFTDGYPLLVTTEASLGDLNDRLADRIGMERFRPNVVVAGSEPWGEDRWSNLTLGQIDCDVVKPCARCRVTTTDQVSGVRDPNQEPLRTLATFRTLKDLGAIFGQNVVPRSQGAIRVGDPVLAR